MSSVNFNSSSVNSFGGVSQEQRIQQYAQQNSISIEQARQDLGAKQAGSGQDTALLKMKPQGPPSGGGKEAFEAQLVASGVPASVVAQGKSAVESYAQQNGITLPTPPAKPAQGGNLNIMS